MPLTKNQERGCGRLERQEIINGEIFAKETGGDEIQSTEGGFRFKQEEGPLRCCIRMEGETMGIMREGSKDGCGCEYICKECQKVEGLSISWCLSL